MFDNPIKIQLKFDISKKKHTKSNFERCQIDDEKGWWSRNLG